jgi:threonine/homoserine/homoserine lactone efflux protein
MSALLQGILMGLTIAVSFGPGFIALFQTSISRGTKAGIVLASGILISDLSLISVSYFGLTRLIRTGNYSTMGIIAGIVLIIFGIITIIRKTSVSINNSKHESALKNTLIALLVKGFLLNLVNPLCLIFWIGIMGFAASNYGMSSNQFFLFFLGLICTAFSFDLIKCYLSGSLRNILASKVIIYLNKFMGLALVVAGIFIIYKAT